MAEQNGQLVQGDQIVKVNTSDLLNATQDKAVMVLKTATGEVKIVVRRMKIGAK